MTPAYIGGLRLDVDRIASFPFWIENLVLVANLLTSWLFTNIVIS